VADGVFTDVQATRGAAAYDAACVRCHRADLGGADGPALKEDRFNRTFAGKPLAAFHDRIKTTMPRGAPGSLSEGVYLDILAHLLRENGFVAGARELTADTIDGVEVLPTRPRPLPPVGEYSYVELEGCLAPGADGGWTLDPTREPVAIGPGDPTGARDAASAMRRAGGPAIELVDAMAFQPESHRGHLLRLRGRLMGPVSQRRMAISALEMLAARCP
jgi:hypothetical protein